MKICMLCTELITQNHKCSWQTTPVISRELKNTLNKIGKKCKKNVTNSLKNSQLNSFLEKYLRIKQIWEYLFCSTFLWRQPRLRIWRVENILRLEKILRLEYIFYGCGPRSDNTAKVKVEFPTKMTLYTYKTCTPHLHPKMTVHRPNLSQHSIHR